MNKVKRIVERPYGRKRNGGWIILTKALIASLKKGEVLELDKVLVGATQLSELLKLLPYDECLITGNGNLSIETVEHYTRKGTNGNRKIGFRKPKRNYTAMTILTGAWVKPAMTKVVVLRPRKY